MKIILKILAKTISELIKNLNLNYRGNNYLKISILLISDTISSISIHSVTKIYFFKMDFPISIKLRMTYLIFLVSLFLVVQIEAQTPVIFDFESQPKGTCYTLDKWRDVGILTDSWEDGMKLRSMVDDSFSVSGKKSLRIMYPKAGVGPEESGAQVPIILASKDQYFASYYLRFSENFDFRLGGKLPGLAGGALCSGGRTCDGTNGFTARFMWRKNGKVVLYLYHMDKPDKWGEDIPLVFPSGEQVVFERGKWYRIVERVKVNSTANSHDGEVEVWVNGIHVLLKQGIRFVSNGEKVDRFYFSTFHGGSGSEWAPNETCYIWYDDLIISEKINDIQDPR